MSNIPKKRPVVIIPYMPKGGVGKTTSAAHIGYSLASKGKALLIDADPQANLTNHYLKPEEFTKESNDKSFTDFLNKKDTFSNCIFKPRRSNEKLQNLYMLGLPPNNDLREFIQFKFPTNPAILKSLITQAKNDDFDYVIFDPPADFGMYTKSLIAHSTCVLALVQPEKFGFDAIFSLVDGLNQIKTGFDADFDFSIAIVNKFNSKNTTHKHFQDEMNESSFNKTFFIPDTNSIPYACTKNLLLHEDKPYNPAIPVFDSIADHIYNYFKE